MSSEDLAVSGDEPDWECDYSRFYTESVPKLVAFLVCVGLSLSDAADCVQEAMIEALPPKWSTLTNPYAWSRTVAYRKALGVLRNIRWESPVAEHPESGPSALISSDTNVEVLEQHLELAHWLGRLNSARQRDVLAWTFDEATPLEIADELGMSPATVRSTLRNARETLRRLRAEDGEHV